MGVITYSQEFKSAIAPLRMFKALVRDSSNIIPKIVPEGIKNIEFIEGDGGVGSIEQTNCGKSSHIDLELLNIDNFNCKYTLIVSDIKFDKIDCAVYKVKFIAAGGGCDCKMTSEYHVKEGCELKEDDIKQGKDKAMGLVKTTEENLLANPDITA